MYFELCYQLFFLVIPNKVELSGINPGMFLMLEIQAIADFAILLDC